jgi:hypothetical protein
MGQFGQRRGKKGISGSHITYFLGKPPGTARGVTRRWAAGGAGGGGGGGPANSGGDAENQPSVRKGGF